MVFSNRLIRRGFLASAMAVGFLLAAPSTWLSPVSAQDSDAASNEPVLVVTLGSVNKLTQDINYVTGVAGQAQAGGMFGLLAGTFTQGMDMTRPIGVVVPMVNGMPQPLALVPPTTSKLCSSDWKHKRALMMKRMMAHPGSSWVPTSCTSSKRGGP